jgi:hypothetical protein
VSDGAWQCFPRATEGDDGLRQAVVEVHQGILRDQLAGDPMLNLALPVEIRALRRIDAWRLLLLLTPWMLARLLFPDDPPGLEVPAGWEAQERRGADYRLLGPSLDFLLLGQPQRAHLNYHLRLGHFLLQPICLDMNSYADGDSVFEAWSQVIRIRDENMEKARRDCPLQKEVSRREFFRRIKGPDKDSR